MDNNSHSYHGAAGIGKRNANAIHPMDNKRTGACGNNGGIGSESIS
jgi:hypothetical protein